MTYADFDLSTDGDGIKHAASPEMVISVVPDGKAKLFHRRAIKKALRGGEDKKLSMLVAELDGVRVYIRPGEPINVIMTKQDLNL